MHIAPQRDYQENILTITNWFYEKWAYLNPERSKADVIKAVTERINTDKIPTALLAFEGDELIGTVCLKTLDMESRKDLSPWLAGLYVKESWRRKGEGQDSSGRLKKRRWRWANLISTSIPRSQNLSIAAWVGRCCNIWITIPRCTHGKIFK